MSYVLGVDGGGSKTVCLLMDAAGQVLGRGEAGASNYQSIGKKSAFFSIQSAIVRAIGYQRLLEIKAICLGLAGVSRPEDMQVAQSFVEQLKSSASIPVIWSLAPQNIVLCHDASIALVGGIGQAVGIVAIAGTGTIVFGRNQEGHTKRVGGWGPILGDEASAYHIAVSGLRAAMRAYDKCDKPTSLQERIREHLGLTSLENLVEVIYQQGWGVREIAALAPIVDRAATSGDEVAMTIIEDAVRELVQVTTVAIDALFTPTEVFEVVTAGSVWNGLSKIRDRFEASLVRQKPTAKVIFPRHEPAYGAGLLALNTLCD
ncbi:MAG TPA: BadF/BadG/BcrA/BcrD ATPase family protein [Chroococcales cyanobacterium]